jgi:DNA-directed RNA polymerase specialized sigma subunit
LLAEAVRRAVDQLTERKRLVTLLYFGIGTYAPLTLEETGRVLRLSREYVSCTRHNALWRLGHGLRSGHILAPYPRCLE